MHLLVSYHGTFCNAEPDRCTHADHSPATDVMLTYLRLSRAARARMPSITIGFLSLDYLGKLGAIGRGRSPRVSARSSVPSLCSRGIGRPVNRPLAREQSARCCGTAVRLYAASCALRGSSGEICAVAGLVGVVASARTVGQARVVHVRVMMNLQDRAEAII